MTNSCNITQNTRIIGTLAQKTVNPADVQMDFISSTIAKMQVETDGIQVLVEMVKKNQLDPWNIDVVDLADRYFEKIIELKMNNLRVTSRVFLFSAILLRLKSDILEGLDPFSGIAEPEENFEADYDDPDFEADLNRNNVISLDEVLQRRSSIRLNRKRTVTLNDLIKHLEFYEKLDKKRSLKNAYERVQRRTQSYAHFTPEDIIDIAHDDYIEEGIICLRSVLIKLFESDERVEMKELQSTGMDKITVYLSLLFLSARNRIELKQDEFYSDVYVEKTEDTNLSEVIE
ncbi:MAG: segregation/condensation protein A [Candidatus Gastranaerophilales bacterium]|nr:segregation/condensation protein A [Candidatus Gastranaerophilales bacterium]